jgi:quercetin dioxygenase-like cupin family protein
MAPDEQGRSTTFEIRRTRMNFQFSPKLAVLGRVRLAVSLVLITAILGVTATTVVPSAAQEEPSPPIQIELLSGRAMFTDEIDMDLRYRLAGSPTRTLHVKDPSRTMVVKITLQPGAQLPWHTHPGPVIVNVVKGKMIVVNASDCVKRPYREETAFLKPGQGTLQIAYNGSHDETVLIATLFDLPEAGPFTITEGVTAPSNCQVP